jgi:hypothetical protein
MLGTLDLEPSEVVERIIQLPTSEQTQLLLALTNLSREQKTGLKSLQRVNIRAALS